MHRVATYINRFFILNMSIMINESVESYVYEGEHKIYFSTDIQITKNRFDI